MIILRPLKIFDVKFRSKSRMTTESLEFVVCAVQKDSMTIPAASLGAERAHDNPIGSSCKCVSHRQELKERRGPDSGVKFAKR